MLWGEQLVARFHSKILGLWLEDPGLGDDESSAQAFARGLVRLVTFLGARGLDTVVTRA